MKCRFCKGIVIHNRCTLCTKVAVPEPTHAAAAQPTPEIHFGPTPRQKATGRIHGFVRLGEAMGDEHLAQMCERSAEQVPLGHPAEKVADAFADVAAFAQTPGGKALFTAWSKAFKSFTED